MRSLNLDQLRTFVEVAHGGSFSAAARQLNMTQPAASLQVRALEERFGVALIERAGKRATATPAGLQLIEHAHVIFEECDRVAASMRRLKEGRTARIRIGSTLTALTYDAPPVLRRLRLNHPEIEIILTNMPTRDAVERMARGDLDFAIVTLPLKNAKLRVTPLRPEEFVAIFPPDFGDAPKVVTPDFVASQTLVLEHDRGALFALVAQWLARGGAKPYAPMRIATVEGIKKVVESGVGMSIIPAVAARARDCNLVTRPLKPAIAGALGLIEPRTQAKSPAIEATRAALLQMGAARRSRKGR